MFTGALKLCRLRCVHFQHDIARQICGHILALQHTIPQNYRQHGGAGDKLTPLPCDKLPTKQHPPHPHARSTTSTAHAANSLTVSTSMEGQGQQACKTSTSTAGHTSTWHAAGTACAAQAGKPGRPSTWSGAWRWLSGGCLRRQIGVRDLPPGL